MQTESFFSVYGSGYVQQRYEAQRAFFRAVPKKARIAAVGVSLSIGLLGFELETTNETELGVRFTALAFTELRRQRDDTDEGRDTADDQNLRWQRHYRVSALVPLVSTRPDMRGISW